MDELLEQVHDDNYDAFESVSVMGYAGSWAGGPTRETKQMHCSIVANKLQHLDSAALPPFGRAHRPDGPGPLRLTRPA